MPLPGKGSAVRAGPRERSSVGRQANLYTCIYSQNPIQMSMFMDPTEKRFTTSTLVAAAGCEIGTFHKWRGRNQLFPETLDATGWNKFSITDVCVVRIIAVLTAAHRLSADMSVNVAQRCAGAISDLFRSERGRATRFLGVYPVNPASDRDAEVFSVREDESVGEAMRIGASAAYVSGERHEPMMGLLTIVDLNWIVIHVIQRIMMLEPDALPKGALEQIPGLALPKPPAALINDKRKSLKRGKRN
jgi:hypothetical protein